MSSFKCNNVPLIVDPQGVDVYVQALQEKVAEIDWIEFSFGKAFTRKKMDEDGRTIRNPYVYDEKREYLLITPCDDVSAFSFVEIDTQEDYSNYSSFNPSWNVSQDMSLVVFANLKRIDNEDYIFTERLKEEVLDKIRTLGWIGSINSTVRGLEDTWTNYTYTDYNPKYFNENFSTFKVNLTAVFSRECFTGNNFNKSTC